MITDWDREDQLPFVTVLDGKLVISHRELMLVLFLGKKGAMKHSTKYVVK